MAFLLAQVWDSPEFELFRRKCFFFLCAWDFLCSVCIWHEFGLFDKVAFRFSLIRALSFVFRKTRIASFESVSTAPLNNQLLIIFFSQVKRHCVGKVIGTGGSTRLVLELMSKACDCVFTIAQPKGRGTDAIVTVRCMVCMEYVFAVDKIPDKRKRLKNTERRWGGIVENWQETRILEPWPV